MAYPTALEYQRALQNPAFAFPDVPSIAQARAELNGLGIPRPYPGSFTATFRLQGDRDWAIRCYLREVRDVAARYSAITKFLETHSDPALTMARLIPQGILIGAARYDIIQMDWVSGDRLDDYVAKLVEADHSRLANLAASFLDLGTRLESLGIAHGDIQHGNVIVEQTGQLRLVDYDDMFLPELRHLRYSSGLGQENYQHPRRTSTNFDEFLDRFSLISIYITLQALSAKPDLWQTHDGGDDNLLFRKADFLDPYASALFQDLDRLGAVRELIDRFASVCIGEYDHIPSLADFLDGRFSYSRFVVKPSETRPSSQGIRPNSTSAGFVKPTSAPPTIGLGTKMSPPGSESTEAIPLIRKVPPTTPPIGTLPDRAPSDDVPENIPLRNSQPATSLPPSYAGIPPMSAGIPPISGAPVSLLPSFGAEPNPNIVLFRALAGVTLAFMLTGAALWFIGSHQDHSLEAKVAKSPSIEARNEAPAAVRPASLLPRPAPLAIPKRSRSESVDGGIGDTRKRGLPPSLATAASQPVRPTHLSSIATVPHREAETLVAKPYVAPRRQAMAEKQSVASLDTSGSSAPRAVDQQPRATATPVCASPDAAAHLVAEATPDLSAQTLSAAAGKRVVVSVDVAADGSVRNTSIVTGSGETRLDLAALSVATRSTYIPTEENCVASPGTVTVTVSY